MDIDKTKFRLRGAGSHLLFELKTIHRKTSMSGTITKRMRTKTIIFLGLFSPLLALSQPANAAEPRIVNIYNFIRNSDFRLRDSEEVLLDCTRHQIELLKSNNLPATWALQYDALINPRYQKLLKERLGTGDEIAAWWEIPQPLAEKAGLKWRGRHEWDPEAHVGFSPGYTPEERRRLVDVYMADFKAIFGVYPRTVGSWYIDEVTLAYMASHYGIIASCNCKDQIGTDFYTLWGGYWNQAYYPSKLNAYMPAQTRGGQIDVPIFRMLGSDPIYEHGTTPGLQSLEPVYPESGGSAKWVAWFMNNLIEQPALAFGYAQAGQENSFGWDAMKTGLTRQIELFAAESKAGKIQVETLEQTGRWFRKKYRLTPTTDVIALDDWKDENHKTIWYDSRFYRLNILWENGTFFIRDFHCFDENLISPTHDTALKQTSLVYETLPIMDWANWSRSATKPVGMWPVLLSPESTTAPMAFKGSPMTEELGRSELGIEQPLGNGGTFSIVCAEKSITFTGTNEHDHALPWALDFVGGSGFNTIVKSITLDKITFLHEGIHYGIHLTTGSCQRSENGDIRLMPDSSGKLIIVVDGGQTSERR